MASWIALHPQWFLHELELLARHYPSFHLDEKQLDRGSLVLFGELKVRPPGGAKSYPVAVFYPEGTPFEHPIVFPISRLPDLEAKESPKFEPQFFDRRHQMPEGNLCLFQRESRGRAGGDVLDITQVLRRAETWFLGHYTGRWPPDTAESELEAHFIYASDVLLAEQFFADDVRGHGRFYMIPDLRRMIDAPSTFKSACPMIVTSMTEEKSGIIKVIDARRELADLYPWIEDNKWDPHKLAAIEDYNSGDLGYARPELGHWWTLNEEPLPFRRGEGVLRLLQTVASDGDAWKLIEGALRGALGTADRHYIAFQYPARSGGTEWLFLVLPDQPRRIAGGIILGQDNRRRFQELPVGCYHTHSISDRELKRRNETVVDERILQKTVALIGLGALGSRVAELLAQAGIGRFRLCDSDHLKPSNVARHIGGITDFGASKVRVVASRLQNINPKLALERDDLIVGSAVRSLNRLEALIKNADLIISTTADESVEAVINQISVSLQKPALYGRSLRRGSLGRVFLVRPRRDACKDCLAEYAYAGRDGRPVPTGWIDIPESGDEVLIHECGRPVIAGSAADLSFIATLISRVAIDFLEDKVGDDNHWIWVGTPHGELDQRLNVTQSTVRTKIPSLSGCRICREPPITEVLFSDEVRRSIVSEAESCPDVETGGVLIGYVDNGRRAIVCRATGPGPKAVKTATRFQRDTEYVQGEIDRAAGELGEKWTYLGEWHSHLEREPEPSPTDVRSLNGIAAAPNYLNANPIMVIAGNDPAKKKVVALRSWVFVYSGRFYRVPNSFESD